jgi:hypothetical protein
VCRNHTSKSSRRLDQPAFSLGQGADSSWKDLNTDYAYSSPMISRTGSIDVLTSLGTIKCKFAAILRMFLLPVSTIQSFSKEKLILLLLHTSYCVGYQFGHFSLQSRYRGYPDRWLFDNIIFERCRQKKRRNPMLEISQAVPSYSCWKVQ